MLEFEQAIEKRLSKGVTQSPKEAYAKLVYILTREFHLSVEEINNLPIPLVNELMRLRDKEEKELEKLRKKKNGK